jgi:hypothetical protein
MLFELVAMTSFPISEGIVNRMIIPPITIGRSAVAELPKVFLESFRLPTGSVENFGGLSTTETKPTVASCAGTIDVRLDDADVLRHTLTDATTLCRLAAFLPKKSKATYPSWRARAFRQGVYRQTTRVAGNTPHLQRGVSILGVAQRGMPGIPEAVRLDTRTTRFAGKAS